MSERLVEQAHALVRSALVPGDLTVDATAGNGHDALFLAQQVGPTGSAFAFDVQRAALRHTAERLRERGLSNGTLVNACHSKLLEHLPAGQFIGAAMFNLGYLPRSDQRVTTQPDTTISAISAALKGLRHGGILSVIAYTGHPGGWEEAEAVRTLLDSLSQGEFERLDKTEAPVEPPRPRLFVVRRAAEGV